MALVAGILIGIPLAHAMGMSEGFAIMFCIGFWLLMSRFF